MKLKSTINYKVKPTHPDIDCMSDWYEGKEYSYNDTYTIDPQYFWGEDDIYEYIKEDLLLIAGGGYDWENIYDVKFDIKEA